MSISISSTTKILIFLLIPYFCYSQLSSPEVYFPNDISTFLNERDFTMSTDGENVYFTRSDFKNKKRFIVCANIRNGVCKNIEIASFSGVFNDLEPFLSPDGNRLFFSSNRDANQIHEKKDYDIWYVDKLDDDSWGNPIRLNSLINSEKDEFFPAVTSSGNLYFTSERDYGFGTEDIFVSEYINGEYQKPKPLSEQINSSSYEFNAYVSPGEDLIIFSSYGRNDGIGGGDLYYSVKDSINNQWMPSKNMGTIVNSSNLDYSPFYNSKTKSLYFTSNRNLKTDYKLSIKEFNEKMRSFDNGLDNIFVLIYDFYGYND